MHPASSHKPHLATDLGSYRSEHQPPDGSLLMAQALHFSQRTRVREALDTHSPGFPLLHGCGAEGLYQSASCLSQPGSSRDGQDISKRLGHRAPGGQLVRRQLLFAPSHLPTAQGWARLGRGGGVCGATHLWGISPRRVKEGSPATAPAASLVFQGTKREGKKVSHCRTEIY